MFMVVEIILKLVYPLKYERELFKLKDGGTLGLDWVIDHEGGKPRKLSSRPIICLMSGLSGGNDNLYLYSFMKEAQKIGYKCVVVNYRGTAGVKITSDKLYWMSGWEDIKEPIDYIH
jgi:predicted alpha/beta-fold hydrolase